MNKRLDRWMPFIATGLMLVGCAVSAAPTKNVKTAQDEMAQYYAGQTVRQEWVCQDHGGFRTITAGVQSFGARPWTAVCGDGTAWSWWDK
ncbi:MAG: hypothetical protein KGL39_12780 [Patescibacteria group bacterium]|nr:hypothetical protein [Patescibacteria group bacterium]